MRSTRLEIFAAVQAEFVCRIETAAENIGRAGGPAGDRLSDWHALASLGWTCALRTRHQRGWPRVGDSRRGRDGWGFRAGGVAGLAQHALCPGSSRDVSDR